MEENDYNDTHIETVKSYSDWKSFHTELVVIALILISTLVVVSLFVYKGSPLPVKQEQEVHYSSEQWDNFNILYDAAVTGEYDEEAKVALIMTSLAESNAKNLANDGTSDILKEDQKPEEIKRSMLMPNVQGVGNDAGSMGILQQQYPWWGSVEELMNPYIAAIFFLEKYDEQKGHNIPAKIQSVQKSAISDGSQYAQFEQEARKIVVTIYAQRDSN